MEHFDWARATPDLGKEALTWARNGVRLDNTQENLVCWLRGRVLQLFELMFNAGIFGS